MTYLSRHKADYANHPDDAISGEGTRLHGGRFVPVGVRAVYASLEEETALREVTTRKRALGGRSQINVGEYPRMTYVLSVATRRNLDLAVTLSIGVGKRRSALPTWAGVFRIPEIG